MIWPFNRKPKIVDGRSWSEAWSIGDIAIVTTHPSKFNSRGELQPQHGEVLEVCEIGADKTSVRGLLIHGLRFTDQRYAAWFWDNRHFRKLRPNESEAHQSWQEMLKNPQRERVE